MPQAIHREDEADGGEVVGFALRVGGERWHVEILRHPKQKDGGGVEGDDDAAVGETEGGGLWGESG